jgi:methionyl-tRNA formyltransferase
VVGQIPIYVISMEQTEKVIILCGSRLALPLIRDLYFGKLLTAVAVPDDSKDFIRQLGLLIADIPLLQVNKQNFVSILRDVMQQHEITVGLVIGFSFKIPAEIFSLPARGFYNFHPGPLPAYRGPDPIFRQIRNREKYAVGALHKVDEGYDTGPIVLTDKIYLLPNDTHGMVTTKLAELASQMVLVLLKIMAMSAKVPARLQDETKANYYKRQVEADVLIDWQTMHADDIIALANAGNPWNNGAATRINNLVIKLVQVEKKEMPLHHHEPGTIILVDDNNLEIATLHGETLVIKIAYAEEGFYTGNKLSVIGLTAGMRFQ